ncbi:hypothetical protein MBLNU459_g3321t2 [Dothideomycetes sp. NU459]
MSDFDLLFSSQGSQHDQEQIAPSDMPSSPLGPVSRMASSKPRKPPSITPKRFTKFFTPSSSLLAKPASGRSGRRLRDITKNAVNRKTAAPTAAALGFEDIQPETPHKRRRLLPCPESSPLQSSPLRPSSHGPLPQIQLRGIDDAYLTDDGDSIIFEDAPPPKTYPQPIRRLRQANPTGRVLLRSFGGSRAVGRGGLLQHCAPWQAQTADFYSRPEDCHSFRHSALPFCATPCHSNSLVAIGDEDGGVRLVDSSSADNVSFAREHVAFKPHHNAVMDIAFSSDDYLFATASGDQTARVIDMRTQQTRYIMTGHMSSVKQVRFQPGNDSIVATSSRDGSVLIWDLRCRGSDAPVSDFRVSFEPGNDMLASRHKQVIYASTCMSIRDAHVGNKLSSAPSQGSTTNSSLFTKPDSSVVPKRLDVSITALSFLSTSRSHLLMTASEANASVKLWDIRHRGPRNGSAIPLSSTPEPASHVRHRPFGINSLALSGDGSRFYALCRDSTVYAYSTNHLILGNAPELTTSASRWRRPREGQTGLGPLYGFRHAQFHAASFYVKAAIRPAKGDRPEMLAVGSRDGSAVLFPTDESLLNRPTPELPEAEEEEDDEEEYDLPTLPTRRPRPSRKVSLTRSKGAHESVPVYEQGTALIRGHSSEVTSLTWTADGDLVTLGDDFRARCWREGPRARELRINGEGEGQRWGCGWADVGESYDDRE